MRQYAKYKRHGLWNSLQNNIIKKYVHSFH